MLMIWFQNFLNLRVLFYSAPTLTFIPTSNKLEEQQRRNLYQGTCPGPDLQSKFQRDGWGIQTDPKGDDGVGEERTLTKGEPSILARRGRWQRWERANRVWLHKGGWGRRDWRSSKLSRKSPTSKLRPFTNELSHTLRVVHTHTSNIQHADMLRHTQGLQYMPPTVYAKGVHTHASIQGNGF